MAAGVGHEKDNWTLVPKTEKLKEFHGLLSIQCKVYSIWIGTEPTLRCRCDDDLESLLQSKKCNIGNVIAGIEHPKEAMKTIMSILLDKKWIPKQMTSCTAQSIAIIKELEEIDSQDMKISSDVSEIKFQVTDENSRNHLLILKFHKRYPQNDPEILTQLPIPFQPISNQTNKLQSIFGQFKGLLPFLQKFWDDVEDLKKKSIIMEPEFPNYSHTNYRINLGSKASMYMSINPQHTENPPECKFLGPESPALQENYIRNSENWNGDLSILQNLQTILKVSIPQKSTESFMNTDLKCGICYCFRLSSEVPDQYCTNTRCHQIFHPSCLLQWIRSIPDCKQSFNTLFGECPYCNKILTITV